jgi:hypothetical protein
MSAIRLHASLYAATGKRIRALPVDPQLLKA